jgi:hypothetical protein
MNTTTIECKEIILADIWMEYRNDEGFKDFIYYNDISLPLAYALSTSIVKRTEYSNKFIEESFALLLAGLEIEDTGFESLEDIFIATQS